jgi:hypothetical protein
LVPASDGGDDFVGVGGPDDFVGVGGPSEGLWIIVGFLKEAVDGGLEIDDRAEHAAFEAALGKFGKKPSTALSHEAEFGV